MPKHCLSISHIVLPVSQFVNHFLTEQILKFQTVTSIPGSDRRINTTTNTRSSIMTYFTRTTLLTDSNSTKLASQVDGEYGIASWNSVFSAQTSSKGLRITAAIIANTTPDIKKFFICHSNTHHNSLQYLGRDVNPFLKNISSMESTTYKSGHWARY